MAALVVLAAGLGRRFGGLKQLAPIGPHGEAIIDYTLRDAASSGFTRAVVVVRPAIAAVLRAHLESRSLLPIRYVEQAETRGTADALLTARSAANEPLAVVNADDYYGLAPLGEMRARLDRPEFRASDALVVAYPIAATLPAAGFVRRALCKIDGTRVTELEELTVGRDGDEVVTERGEKLAPDAPVSMNLWGFHPAVFDEIASWIAGGATAVAGEYQLPDFIAARLADGTLEVDALRATGGWFGITRPSDLDAARVAARTLGLVPVR